MRRIKLSRRANRRNFKSGANVKKMNNKSMRGGIRL